MSKVNPTVALLMVTYNRQDLLRRILKSIQNFQWHVSNFVIIDNGSKDDTISVLNEYKGILDLSIISQSENLGHGAGLAVGLDYLKANFPTLEYVIFLEDDSIPTFGYYEFLVSKIHNSNFTMISSSGSLVRLGKRIKVCPIDSEIISADFALFDGAIVRFQDLLKVGFPVMDWFMMFDDFEYCYRIRKRGFRIGVVANPYLEILHEGWGGGVSHSHIWRSYYQSRNFILFVKKHFDWFNFLDALILQSKRVMGGLVSTNARIVTKMRILGIWDGFMNVKGKSLNIDTLKRNYVK